MHGRIDQRDATAFRSRARNVVRGPHREPAELLRKTPDFPSAADRDIVVEDQVNAVVHGPALKRRGREDVGLEIMTEAGAHKLGDGDEHVVVLVRG